MKKLNILHISDLHFKQDGSFDTIKDINKKDQKSLEIISKTLKKETTYKDSKDCFFVNVFGLFGNEKFDLIACTGDLGYQNLPGSIEKGAHYIGKLADILEVSRENVIITPGNHDLDRDAENGKEFEKFTQICSSKQFTFPKIMEPVLIEKMGIPIIALNSCLGGTEHALLSLPQTFWDIVKKYITENVDLSNVLNDNIPEELKFQIQAMDIPAIGKSQLKSMWDYLGNKQGNFSIILCHHNPMPAYYAQIRPYSSIIDSGPFIYGLWKQKKRAFILHGHTHCEGVLTTHEEDQKEHGFVTTIGSYGLFSSSSAAVTSIKILIDSDNNFLAGIITRHIKKGDIFQSMPEFYVLDRANSIVQSKYSLDKVEANKQLEFSDFASILGKEKCEKTAEDLLRLSSRRQINITNIDKPIENWIISKIG